MPCKASPMNAEYNVYLSNLLVRSNIACLLFLRIQLKIVTVMRTDIVFNKEELLHHKAWHNYSLDFYKAGWNEIYKASVIRACAFFAVEKWQIQITASSLEIELWLLKKYKIWKLPVLPGHLLHNSKYEVIM